MSAEADTTEILLLEDSELDADLIGEHLRKGGLAYRLDRVWTRADFIAALERCRYDLIIADYALPSFDGLSALDIAHEKMPAIPFILVSGTLDEEMAIEAMRKGATDFITKQRLNRLPAAAKRAFAEAEEKLARKLAEKALRDSEARFRGLIGASNQVLYRHSPDWTEMRHLAGGGFLADTEFPDPNWFDAYIHPDDQEHVWSVIQEAVRTKTVFELEHRVIREDGSLGWTLSRSIPMLDDQGEIVEWFGAASDVTARREAEDRQAFLLELSDALRPLMAPADIAGLAAARLGERLGVSRVCFGEIRGDRWIVLRDHSQGVPTIVGEHPVAMFGEAFLAAYKPGAILTVGDVAAVPGLSPEARAELRKREIAAFVDIVLTGDDRQVSVLAVQHARPRAWTQSEEGLIRDVAERTRSAIERAKAEDALRKSEGRFRAFVTASSDVVYRMNADWKQMNQLDGRGFLSDTSEPTEGWMDDYLDRDDQPAVKAAIERAVQARSLFELEHRVRRADGTFGWTLSRAVPILDEDGTITEWLGTATDITERKTIEERQGLLMRELHHRVKNTLATVQSIMNFTLRTSDDMEAFRTGMTNRITSLARSHTLLTDNEWASADLGEIIYTELEPYDDGTRLVMEGPTVHVPVEAAVPLAMAVHELTTNAAKHGSLSVPEGRLAVTWKTTGVNGGRLLCLEWIESRGPQVAPPTRHGFGSTLLERLLGHQLGGKVEVAYRPEGVSVRIEAPMGEAQGTRAPRRPPHAGPSQTEGGVADDA